MRKSDLSPARRARLVPVPGRSGAYALIPPPTPRIVRTEGGGKRLALAHEQLGRLAALAAALPNADLITRTLARREAVSSSQLEGTQSDLDDLLAYEATGSPHDAKPDVRVTANYVIALEEALRELRSAPERTIDEPLIQNLHRHLMNGISTYHDAPGAYREDQNWIGGPSIYDARLVPPPPEHVPACMVDLAAYLSDPHDPESPYPFRDGNGRVGRLLMPLMLAREGYPPLYMAGYLCRHQREYFDTLLGVQTRDSWAPWLDLLAQAVYTSAKEAITLTEKLIATREQLEQRVSDARADSLLRRMPTVLLAHPALSARRLQSLEGVSFPTAKSALDSLAERGLVQTKKVGREVVYVATAISRTLAGNPNEMAPATVP
jgi:Fic family protein